MASFTILRQMIKNGWTIANRRNIISQIGKNNFDEIALLAGKTGRTGDVIQFCDIKGFLRPDRISATKEALTQTNIAYHGSSFLFDVFDVTKIASGEGSCVFGRGIYLARTKRVAPRYANIRSKDAVIHFGSVNTKLANTNPTVYTVEGIDKLNLKLCGTREARTLSRSQEAFQAQNPHIDGIELPNGEITVFPESIHKLSIARKDNVIDFVKANKNYKFVEWTTDTEKLNSIYNA